MRARLHTIADTGIISWSVADYPMPDPQARVGQADAPTSWQLFLYDNDKAEGEILGGRVVRDLGGDDDLNPRVEGMPDRRQVNLSDLRMAEIPSGLLNRLRQTTGAQPVEGALVKGLTYTLSLVACTNENGDAIQQLVDLQVAQSSQYNFARQENDDADLADGNGNDPLSFITFEY